MTCEVGRGLARLLRLLAFGCSSSPEIDFSCLPIVPPTLPGCICATATAGAKNTLTAKMSQQTKYIGLPKKPNRTKGRLQLGRKTPPHIDVQQLVNDADQSMGALRCQHWPSPNDHRLGTPDTPAIRSTRAADFVASLVRFRYSLPGCSPTLYGSDWNAQPSGTFTSKLSTDRSPFPLLDITTTPTGLLCWRDSHPLEWQLASLHGHS